MLPPRLFRRGEGWGEGPLLPPRPFRRGEGRGERSPGCVVNPTAENKSGRLSKAGPTEMNLNSGEKVDEINHHTVRFLRTILSVLAPNGSSSKAPAIIVVGSGTGTGTNWLPGF